MNACRLTIDFNEVAARLAHLEEDDCRKPCDPDWNCPHCADYWQRMVNEGLWDMDRHRWTEAGWREIVK